MNVRQALYAWRDSEARAKNIEGFRVFPNATLDAIAVALPKNKEELLLIKGIKEVKFSLYGKAILRVIAECLYTEKEGQRDPEAFISLSDQLRGVQASPERPIYSIAQYVDILNRELSRISVRVRGEVVSITERGNALYFSIKDTEADAVLNVFMWTSDYRLSGVELDAGKEIIIEGRSEIYKPNGRLSFRAQTVELVGEGALRKAYEALRKRLADEGLFSEANKRRIDQFSVRIGVITSKEGAVIHDFLNNLGNYGFEIKFIDSRVEGVLAVKELYSAIKQMRSVDIDALVLIRGGGSLESLQAFNNEHVVRALAAFPKPVICAIGHDKDVPLAQLVADYAPSTPTACTALLNQGWSEAEKQISIYQQTMLAKYDAVLRAHELTLLRGQRYVERVFAQLESKITEAINAVEENIPFYLHALEARERQVREYISLISQSYLRALTSIGDRLTQYKSLLDAHDPLRQLRLGYSILRAKDGILRSVKDVKEGDTIEGMLVDGTLRATVIQKEYHDKKTTND